MSLSADQLEVCEEVGRGGFGVVYRGIISATGTEVAIKQIDLEHESADFFEVYREIQILSECQSPHITSYLGCFVKDHTLWVIMEFVDGGSLFDLLKPGHIDDESTVAAVAHGMLSALEYLHSQGKIHRDLKSQNILLNHDGCVKLTDFGVSTQLYSNFSRRNTTVGTPYWMAPEVIMSTGGHSYKADIWSLGCCVFELRNGKPPLQEHYTPMQALRKISSCTTDNDFVQLLDLHAKDTWSGSLRDFLQRCLVVNPQDRASASTLLRHPFITNNIGSEPESRKRVRKLITRKRLWDQEHHEFKSHKFYAPTEIANNQRKWQGHEPQVQSIHFDFSTIKDSPTPSSRNKPPHNGPNNAFTHNGPMARSERQLSSSPGAKDPAQIHRMRTEFQKMLNKVFHKIEQRASLSTAQYDAAVALNKTLLEMFAPLHSSEVSVFQNKTLACQYLKYLLRELSKPTSDASRVQLQRAILPSSLVVTEATRRRGPPTAMDEIEKSLLGSWLDKMGDKQA